MVKKSLGFYIVISFLVALAGVIAIGGISIFMVDKMMDKIYSIEKESKNVDFVNHLHHTTYNCILSVHDFMITRDQHNSTLAINLLSEMERDLQRYIEYEKGETTRESDEEVRLLRLLQENFSGMKGIVPVFKEFSPNVAYNVKKLIYLEKYAYNIETLITEINRLHFDIISRKVEKSHKTISFVFTLYVIFSCFGFVVVYSGYKIHSHFIIKPIKKLAEATQKLSGGDLSVRVDQGSKTEIGVLYNSFNNMAEKLQAYEKNLLDFNYELEQKVKESDMISVDFDGEKFIFNIEKVMLIPESELKKQKVRKFRCVNSKHAFETEVVDNATIICPINAQEPVEELVESKEEEAKTDKPEKPADLAKPPIDGSNGNGNGKINGLNGSPTPTLPTTPQMPEVPKPVTAAVAS